MIEYYFLFVAGFSCSFAIIAYLVKIFRLYRKVKVNCWFCNKNTSVEYQFSNSFVCPFCEQYNGFKEDGDYNCIIPDQHSESYRYSDKQLFKQNSAKEIYTKFENGFCESCNLNQALKIRALAEFSSVSSDDNDEVEKFRERLEEIYGLCQHCQAILSQTLGKQNSWLKPLLISWRILQSKKKLLKAKSSKILKGSLMKYVYLLPLVICSLLCLLSLEKYCPEMLKTYKEDFEKGFARIGAIYLVLLYTGIALQCCSMFFQPKRKVNTLVSLIGWCTILVVQKSESTNQKDIPYLQLMLNFSNLLLVLLVTRKTMPVPVETTKTNGSLKKFARSVDSSFISNPTSKVTDFPLKEDSFSSTNESFEEQPSVKSELSKQQDLDAELLSLKISTPKKCENSNFSPQNLFRGNSNYKPKFSTNGNVLQPSKFGKHFITQSSWVAGGYWGNPGSPQRGRLTRQNVSYLEEVKPKQVFSLSRSSSQSSGFVSQFSECASSRSQNIFQTSPKQTQSQKSSLSGENNERVSAHSLGCGFTNGGSPSSVKSPQIEVLEAQSACSASSYYSDNSQFRRRPSSRSSSCCRDGNKINYVNDLEVCHRHQNSMNNNIVSMIPNYFNLGIAFFLGISLTANLFLILMLWHYDVFVK